MRVVVTPTIDPQVSPGFVTKTVDVGDRPLFKIAVKLSVSVCCWQMSTQMQMQSAPSLPFPNIKMMPH